MLKNSVFLLGCITLFSGCFGTNAYVKSEYLIEKNAAKHKLKELKYSESKNKNSYEPIITPEEYKKMLAEQTAANSENKEEDLNQILMDFYNEWKNVKYKLGGNSKRGIDCSAFTQRIFKEKFDINIPRTTRTQVNIGKKIDKSELETGDLVFFKTGLTDRHVGIYMGNGNFMHASIKGVKFTKINKPFYKKNYWTSRRVFD